MRSTFKVFGLALSALLALPALATNLVTNGGFELPGLDTPPYYRYLQDGDNTSLTGWTVLNDGIGESPYISHGAEYQVAEGTYSVVLNQGSGVEQMLTLQPNREYRFGALLLYSTGSPLQITIGSTQFFMGVAPEVQYFNFTTSGTESSVLLRLFNPSPVGDYKQTLIDSVSVVSSVPEASTTFMMLAGGLGMAAFVRARRRQAEQD